MGEVDRAAPRLEYPRYYSLSDDGDYFVADTATPATGVAYYSGPVTTGFTDTGAYVVLFNSSTGTIGSGGVRVYLDYIQLIMTAAPTAATAAEVIFKMDNINKVTSGGTVLTSNNANMDVTKTAQAVVTIGQPVLAAGSSSARRMNREKLLTVIPRVGDSFLFQFGPEYKGFAGGVLNGSNPQQLAFPGPPMILGPGHSISLHLWHPGATAAPSYEVEAAWWER